MKFGTWIGNVLSYAMCSGRKSLSFILTWNNCSELVHIAVNQAILQRAPSHSRNSNEDQSFPAEGRHSGDLWKTTVIEHLLDKNL